jgi:hypothetical protein
MPLDPKVEPGSTLNTAFRVEPGRLNFEGALLCRLRKKGIKSDQQSDTDTINIDEDWSNYVQLLVGWRLGYFLDPRVYMLLAEHGEKLVWTEAKLEKQHKEFHGRLRAHNGAIEDTWLMEDGSVLRLALDSVGTRACKISITISEAQLDGYTTVPLWIEPIV